MNWAGYPETNKEFEHLRSFRVHDLDVLLKLTGREAEVRSSLLTEWSAVVKWDPGARYQRIGTANEADTKLMLKSARVLLKRL